MFKCPLSASLLWYLLSTYLPQKQLSSVDNTRGMISGLSKLEFVEPVACVVQLVRTVFSLPSSLVIPNPVTAAVHTMGNPIMTQLCVEIKTNVGYEQESYLLELKGDGGLLLCVHWGRVNSIKCSPANTSPLEWGPTWLLLRLKE